MFFGGGIHNEIKSNKKDKHLSNIFIQKQKPLQKWLWKTTKYFLNPPCIQCEWEGGRIVVGRDGKYRSMDVTASDSNDDEYLFLFCFIFFVSIDFHFQFHFYSLIYGRSIVNRNLKRICTESSNNNFFKTLLHFFIFPEEYFAKIIKHNCFLSIHVRQFSKLTMNWCFL